MNGLRITTFVLFMLSFGCCTWGGIMMLTSRFGTIRMPDGTPAAADAMIMTGLLVMVPGFLAALIGGVLWWQVRPEQILRATHREELERLREIALYSYIDWMSILQRDQSQRPRDAHEPVYLTMRERTLNLLLGLDPVRKRVVIQFLYDIQMIRGPHSLDLRGADLRGADLRGADLRGAVLREVDLRGAWLSQTRLDEADLRGALLNPDQLASVPTQPSIT